MKLRSYSILLGSIVILASSSAASARGKGQGHKSAKAVAKDTRMVFESTGEDAVVSEPAAVDTSEGGSGDAQEVTDSSGNGDTGNENVDETSDGGGSVSDSGNGGENGEPILDKNPEGDGAPVPITWVTRGNSPEDPNVIFYNIASGPPPSAAAGAAKGIVVRGQADKGAAIEANEGAAAPLINHEKKGPVALVKKGRVFLR